MIVEFDYTGSIEHLDDEERAKIARELDEAMPGRRRGEYDLFVDEKEFACSGSYDDDDGYNDYVTDIENILRYYDITWSGGATEYEYDPDWDSMTSDDILF